MIHVSGHRGARGLAPENTLEGFALAFALGVDSVELDVALTADGVPVVVHDPVLGGDIARGPGGRWLGQGVRVGAMARAALHRLDVGRLRPGSAYAAQFPAQRPRDGARIPALLDVLALARPTRAVVDIEIKTMPDQPALTAAPERMVDAVLAAVAALGMAGRVVLRSFDWRGLRHARRVAPAIPLVHLTSPSTERAAMLWWGAEGPAPDAVAGQGGTVWAPAHAALTREQVARARALGLGVMPWTVNELADMRRLIDWGVSGICTDYPDRLIALA